MNPQQQLQQQMQRQMQQQMQDQQRRMQMAAYARQQEQLRQQQEQLRQEEETKRKFQHAQRQASRLRSEFDAGRLSEDQLQAQLRNLMVQDQHGAWWMVDSRSGRWFRHDNTTWTQADPYQSAVNPPPNTQVSVPSQPLADEEEGKKRFQRAEREASQLRSEFDAGRLSEDQLKAQLRNLMVQDQHGTWWMVDSRTGQWFRYDNSTWTQADPYQSTTSYTSNKAIRTSRGQQHHIKAVFALVAGLAVAVVWVIVVLGNFVLADEFSWMVACVFLPITLAVTAYYTRYYWRGY